MKFYSVFPFVNISSQGAPGPKGEPGEKGLPVRKYLVVIHNLYGDAGSGQEGKLEKKIIKKF